MARRPNSVKPRPEYLRESGASSAPRAERDALKAGDLRPSLATRAAGFGVFEWDIAQDPAMLENARCYEIFGRPPEQGPINLAEFTRQVIHPEDLDRSPGDNAATLKSGRGRSTRRIRRQNDGAIRWVDFFGTQPTGCCSRS